MSVKITVLSLVVVILQLFAPIVKSYVVTTPGKWTTGLSNQICISLSRPITRFDKLTIAIWSPVDIPVDDVVPRKKLLLVEGEYSVCDEIFLKENEHKGGTISIRGQLEGKSVVVDRRINFAGAVTKTFVQTDKSLYKAAQMVQFRILTVQGPFLKVSTDQYDAIWVENPSGIRIHQWLNVSNEDGLIHKSIQLSEEPEQGKYLIKVRFENNKEVSTDFEVKDFVLPRFEVTVQSPAYILANAENVEFEVCARYTFGQFVKGNATLIIGIGDVKKTFQNKKASECVTFTVTLESINEMISAQRYFYDKTINAEAVVEEEGTGTLINSNKIIVEIKKTALMFQDISPTRLEKSALPFKIEVKVTHPDGTPAVSELMNVCRSRHCDLSCNSKSCKRFSTDANGLIKLFVPTNWFRRLTRVESVNHREVKEGPYGKVIMEDSAINIEPENYISPSDSYLQIAVDEKQIRCSTASDDIQFEIPVWFSSNRQTSAIISLQVISRGQIQFSKTFKQIFVENNKLNIDESLLTQPMSNSSIEDVFRGNFAVPVTLRKTISPKTKVIIWYTRNDGEVVADYRNINIEKCLPNDVNLAWSSRQSEPGDDVTLSLKTESNSLCSLGVVDKSVQLLSNEISKLTTSSLLKITDHYTLSNSDTNQLNDNKYCRAKRPGEQIDNFWPMPRRLVKLPNFWIPDVPNRPKPKPKPIEYYTTGYDALRIFVDAGLHVISDQSLETRYCERKSRDWHDVYDWDYFGPHLRGMSDSRFGGSTQRQNEVDYLDIDDSTPEPDTEPINEVTTSEDNAKPRTHFPQTWLWSLVKINENGIDEKALTLPDTVTEWVGSAVCVHPTKGVGVSNVASITTFRDFFADLTIPASVKRGETFPVKISVFNYLKESLPIRVILKSSSDYEIIPDKNFSPYFGSRSSCLAPEDKEVFSIKIKPSAVGLVNITVSAFVDVNSVSGCGNSSRSARSDVLIKPIRVDIEGFIKEKAFSKYVCSQEHIEDFGETITEWNFVPPKEIIPDSVRGFVSVAGDMMSPVMNNLDHLVQMPTGCGEQNMIGFAPNIFVMQYLEATNQKSKEVGEKAIQYMENGYQRELNYRHKDGSFSAFGENDDSGSTWLTAFVYKCFAQSTNYITIDSHDMEISREWLMQKQMEDGCFKSVGKVAHKEMKGGIVGKENSAVLSSFVLISLLEAGESPTSKTVQKAVFCLKADGSAENSYNLALKSYALALANSSYAYESYESLKKMEIRTNSGLHFKLPNAFESNEALGVETAGYAILACLKLFSNSFNSEYLSDANKIVKWINNKRNGGGGFVSTQDTVVALQALAEYEKVFPNYSVDLTAVIATNGRESQVDVNQHNRFLEQKHEISSFPATINIEVFGKGCLLLQGIMRYNVPNPEASHTFHVSVSVESVGFDCKTKRITACASYLLEDGASNMAIIEVDLISGYIPKKDDLKALVGGKGKDFKRYEVDGSLVTFYADELTPKETCASFRILREVVVEDAKPGSVKVYDYYKPEYFVSEKYTLPFKRDCVDQVEEIIMLQ